MYLLKCENAFLDIIIEAHLGFIDGFEVIGHYMPNGGLYCAEVTWRGITISTDGIDSFQISTEERRTLLKPLMIRAAITSGAVDTLMAFAQQHRRIDIPRAALAEYDRQRCLVHAEKSQDMTKATLN